MCKNKNVNEDCEFKILVLWQYELISIKYSFISLSEFGKIVDTSIAYWVKKFSCVFGQIFMSSTDAGNSPGIELVS